MVQSDPNNLVDEPVSSSLQDREEKVEELKQQSDIQKALKQTAGRPEPSPVVQKKQKAFVGTYLVVLALLGCFCLPRVERYKVTNSWGYY